MRLNGFGTAYVSAWLQPRLRDELDELARRHRVTRSEEIRAALIRHVAEHEPEPETRSTI